MSAVVTDCRDSIRALERAVAWGFCEMPDRVDDHAAIHARTCKICRRVVQELEFAVENSESHGDHRDAYRARRQAQGFAARFGQFCEPIRVWK